MSAELSLLRRELQALRGEVHALRERVEAQEDQIAGLLAEREYEVVEPPSTPSPLPAAGRPSSSTSSATGPPGWEERLALARATGEYLRDALTGVITDKPSKGRHSLPNRVYVLIRDVNGTEYTHPVRVFRAFKDLEPLVKKQGSFKDSVFVGLPSQREAQAAVGQAGFAWPSSLE